MYFNHTRRFKAYKEKELRVRMYYIYLILNSLDEKNKEEGSLYIVIALANAMGKIDRLKEILDKHIQILIKKRKLKLVPEEDYENVWSFSGLKKNALRFYQDNGISNFYSGYVGGANETEANILRCNFCGGKQLLLRIFEQVFFSDSAPASMRKITIPAQLKKEATELTYAKFLYDEGLATESTARILQALYICSTSEDLHTHLYSILPSEFGMCSILGFTLEEINAFQEERVGVLSKFFNDDFSLCDTCHYCFLAGSIQPLFIQLARKLDIKNSYPISSFPVKKEVSAIAKTLLKREGNTHILLYGAAGSGKTEYAKSLAKACGLKAVRFKNSYEMEVSTEGAISGLNVMLSVKRDDTVFIIDEAENILESGAESIFGKSYSKKGTINKLFENCKNRVIWIVNYTDSMDDSTKRRFTYSVEFEKLSEKSLIKISQNKLKTINCPPTLKKTMVNLCGEYNITGASVNNMIKVMEAFEDSDEQSLERNVRNVLESNSQLINGSCKMRQKSKNEYDLSVINSTIPADQIIEMIENAQKYAIENFCEKRGIRMLFYGLSGTGKTEFARYIAQKLGKKILIRRPSDIISKWVGDSEKNISDAFEEAERSDKILLFDEADSFFRDRTLAEHEWEITKTNEFLTQMEEFKGILICTTNLRNAMDKAMLRRFHICTEFKSLNEGGIKRLLSRYFSSIRITDNQLNKLAGFTTITPGDFGTLSDRIRFMSADKVNGEFIIQELSNMQKEKTYGEAKKIGFC